MAHRAAAVLLLLCLAAAGATGALLLSRPEGECIAPALTSLSQQYNFYPKAYQLQSISASTSSSGLSTTVEFAEDFSVTYRGTFKVVVNKRVNETYLLYQCGSPNPLDLANTELGLPANTKVFEIPLVSVAVADSTAQGFLLELGLADRVAFANEYSYNGCMQTIRGCNGAAQDVGQLFGADATNATLAALRDQQGSQVDAIFTSEATKNPKSIAVTAFADPGVLNRAEWVKFVAVFFNKEVEANNLFNKITNNFQQLNTSARAAAAKKARPVVAWLSKYGDAISFSFAAYKTQFITVDIIIDDSYDSAASNFPDLAAFLKAYGLTPAAAAAIPAVKNGQVWAPNNRLGAAGDSGVIASDWFESSVARPDLVLADFVAIITPAAVTSGVAAPSWLRRDCTTGELKAVTDPATRCDATPACPDAVLTPAATSSSSQGQPSASQRSAAGAIEASYTTLLFGVVVLLLL
eukprot:gene8816-8995_t